MEQEEATHRLGQHVGRQQVVVERALPSHQVHDLAGEAQHGDLVDVVQWRGQLATQVGDQALQVDRRVGQVVLLRVVQVRVQLRQRVLLQQISAGPQQRCVLGFGQRLDLFRGGGGGGRRRRR